MAQVSAENKAGRKRAEADDTTQTPQKRSKVSPRHGKEQNEIALVTPSSPLSADGSSVGEDLACLLYSPQVTAKIWGVAQQCFSSTSPPTLFPEYTRPGGTAYVYREREFWTSGFFPGSLYLLLERQRRYDHRIEQLTGRSLSGQQPQRLQLEFMCKWWTETLHDNAKLTNTHDLGFMICPWSIPAWELLHDERAYQTTITAAKSLLSRFDSRANCLRSWDSCITKRYSFQKPEDGFLVIIDNLMNLDLLFWAASQLGDKAMYHAAVRHAETSRQHHVRPDFSTCHVVVLEPNSNKLRCRITNQGYSDGSSWTRGQAWAIAGFAQTYHWTRDVSFLDTAASCADYFLSELPASKIPPWDFKAPRNEPQPTDTSAACIAAYGMLLIHEAVTALGRRESSNKYLGHALDIVRAVVKTHMTGNVTFHHHPKRSIETAECGVVHEASSLDIDMGGECETILGGATINNYEFAPRRWANHGLVYADYYLLLFGNKLLEMGLDVKLRGIV